jgi:hypothetical protein
VGEAVGPVSEIGVTGGVVDGASGSASPVHATRASATQRDAIAPDNVVENLC